MVRNAQEPRGDLVVCEAHRDTQWIADDASRLLQSSRGFSVVVRQYATGPSSVQVDRGDHLSRVRKGALLAMARAAGRLELEARSFRTHRFFATGWHHGRRHRPLGKGSKAGRGAGHGPAMQFLGRELWAYLAGSAHGFPKLSMLRWELEARGNADTCEEKHRQIGVSLEINGLPRCRKTANVAFSSGNFEIQLPKYLKLARGGTPRCRSAGSQLVPLL